MFLQIYLNNQSQLGDGTADRQFVQIAATSIPIFNRPSGKRLRVSPEGRLRIGPQDAILPNVDALDPLELCSFPCSHLSAAGLGSWLEWT